MKLPRWLMVTLCAVCVCLVVMLAWSWWTLPDRTMRNFVVLIREGKFEQAREVVSFPANWSIQSGGEIHILDKNVYSKELRVSHWKCCFQPQQIQPQSRTLLDVILGQQRFRSDILALDVRPIKVDGHLISMEILLTAEFLVQGEGVRILPLQKSAVKSSVGR